MGKRHKTIEDDAALWARVAETATPLEDKTRAKTRLTKGASVPSPGGLPAPKKPAKSARKPIKPAGLQGKTAPKSAAKSAVKKNVAPATSLDRQTARRLGKGRLTVEARLDLHGMRQREAHGALRKFLHWARAKDYRHVLIITGKGITGKGAPREEGQSFYEEEARGVLRQAVPQWLTRGDLAPMIVAVSEAPRQLGGGGALYVRLRRTNRDR